MAIMFTSQHAYLICLATASDFAAVLFSQHFLIPHRSSAVQHPTVLVSHHLGLNILSTHSFWQGGEEEIFMPTKQVFRIILLSHMGIFRRADTYQAYLSLLLSTRTQVA